MTPTEHTNAPQVRDDGNAPTRSDAPGGIATSGRGATPARPVDPSRRRRRLIRVGVVVLVVVLLYTLGGFLGVPWLVKGPILSRINDRLNGLATIDSVSCNPYTLRLVLRDLRVADAGGDPIATVGEVDVNASLWRTIWRPGYQAQWAIVRDVWAKASVSEEGRVSVESLFKPAPPPKPGEEPKPLKRWPRLVVETLRVEPGTIQLSHNIDATATYSTTLKNVVVRADGLDLGVNVTSTIAITATTERDESFDIEVLLTPDPLTLRVNATASAVAVDALSPYGIEYAGLNVRLVQGKADAQIVLDLKPSELGPQAMVELHRLTARDVRVEYVDGPYAGMMTADVPRIDLEDISVDAVKRTLHVERIAITGSSAFARRNEAGQLDLETVLHVTQEAGEEIVRLAAGELIPERAAGEAAPQPRFEIPAKALSHEYPTERIILGVMRIADSARGQWSVRATTIDIDGSTLAWQDSGAPGAVAFAASAAHVKAGPIDSEKRFEIPVQISATLGGGTARIEGVVRPLDLEVDARVVAENVDAAIVAGYIPANLGSGFDNATLSKALANVDGTLRGKMTLAEATEPTIDARWEGRAGLTDLAITHATPEANPQTTTSPSHDDENTLVGAKTLTTTGTLLVNGPLSALDIAWDGSASTEVFSFRAAIVGAEAGPIRANLERGDVSGKANLVVRTEGVGLTTDLSAQATGIRADAPGIRDLRATIAQADVRDVELDLAAKKARIEAVVLQSASASTRVPVLPARKESGAAPAARDYIGIPEPAFAVEIGRIALEGASARVEDPNTMPPMVMVVDRVEATLEGIATREGAPITIRLDGMVQESGRVSIAGVVDLFRALPSGEVHLEVASMPLTGFDAATGRFLGYEVDRGRATVDMPLTLKDGELSGNVKINLDRFYLGDEVESEEALNVPVQLGLSLLRDTNEQIDATVGVKGRIDEPGFTIAGLVWKAISNLIVKAATAPFEILGSLFGSEEDLSRVAFDPGTDRLGAASLARLDTLARAMRERPGISLAVFAQPSPKADVPVLKREGLRAWIFEAVRTRDPRIVSLTEDLYRAQLNDAFMVQATALSPQEREATPFEAREEFLLERVEVAPERLIELANVRAQRVVDVLVKDGGVPAERVTLTPATDATDAAPEPETRLEIGK